MNKIKQYIKRLLNIIKEPEMKILPGQLAFFLFLSLVPIITLVVYFGLIFSVGTDSISVLVNKIFPIEISNLLKPYVNDIGIDFNTIIFMITGFIVASNGPNSLIITSNTLYKIKQDNYIKGRIKALFMTILLIVLFIFTLIVLAFGDKIMLFISNISLLKNIGDKLILIYSLLKWPLALFIIYFIVKILYTWSPSKNIPSKYMKRGAIFTTIMWCIVSMIYSFYINNYANYNLFYGSLANIVVIMIWVYALSYILVIGMIINNEHYIKENG